MFSDAELAYAAGLIDGEGCIGVYNTRPKASTKAAHFQSTVRVCMKTPEPILWLWDRWPFQREIAKTKGGPTKPGPYFTWQARNKQAEEFLQQVRPFLVLKGPQADVLLEFAEFRRVQREAHPRHLPYTPEMLTERLVYVDKLKALKRPIYSFDWSLN